MKKKKKINFEYEINTHIRLCLFSNVKGDFFSYTFLLVNSIINESTWKQNDCKKNWNKKIIINN